MRPFATFFATGLAGLGGSPHLGIIVPIPVSPGGMTIRGHDHKLPESKPPVRLALYQPDIPQNAAALMRLGACLGVAVELIEPCGFVLGERRFRRAGMDYLEAVELTRHASWDAFEAWRHGQGQQESQGKRKGGEAPRLLLLTTKGETPYCEFTFHCGDILLAGRESAGVPDQVRDAADAALCVPMREGMRSLNVALAMAMALGEGLRQTKRFPGDRP